MNYIILILILVLFMSNHKKEYFTTKDSCRKCRIELTKEKRKNNEKINPNQIFKQCISDGDCKKADYCNKCITKYTSDPELIRVIDEHTKEDGFEKDVTVDLNKCKRFRYCRDEFDNGFCSNDKKWKIDGHRKHCCKPCMKSLEENLDEADESKFKLARTCLNNLKLDNDPVCTRQTLNFLKSRKAAKKNRVIQRRINRMKKQVTKKK